MDSNPTDDVQNLQPEAMASGSVREKRRKRARSSSSSSSASSSSSSTTSSSSSSDSSRKGKKSRRRRRRRRRTKRHGERRVNELVKEVSELRKYLSNMHPMSNSGVNMEEDIVSVDPNVSGELYAESDNHETNPTVEESLQLEATTKIKEPAVPKAPEQHLKLLDTLQRFNTVEWCEVRYADTQKNYNFSPGFVELDINEEVKAYDSLRNLAYSDKTFAALTFCALQQREVLQTSLRSLLSWYRNNENTSFDTFSEKLNELFLNGEFPKVSADLLQLICGHRAEIIQMRRDGITNSVRDPLVKAAIRKIPPSNQHVFNAEKFTNTVEKAGGVRKAFWPTKSSSKNPAPQAGTNKTAKNQNLPQRFTPSAMPSQGSRHTGYTSGFQRYNAPSQGANHYGSYNRPSQGRYNNDSRGGSSNNVSRSRAPQQLTTNGRNKTVRKRGASPFPDNRGGKRRRF